MVMKLKESESKLEKILIDNPENQEVPPKDAEEEVTIQETVPQASTADTINNIEDITPNTNIENKDSPSNAISKSENNIVNESLVKKVTNIENKLINKNLENSQSIFVEPENVTTQVDEDDKTISLGSNVLVIDSMNEKSPSVNTQVENECNKQFEDKLKEILRQNIISCSEKLSLIEDLKNKNVEQHNNDIQVVLLSTSVPLFLSHENI